MRLFPLVLIGVLTVAVATALAVPFVIHSQFGAQQPSATKSLDEPVEMDNALSKRGSRRGEVLQRLNLTRDQFKQLVAVRRQYQPLIRDRALMVRTSQSELRRLLASSASDAEVKNKHQKLQQLRQELQQIRFESVLAMRQILTPEQRQAFALELDARRSSWRDRF